ncbi:amine oxidase [Gyrodon lividus]|nr:amine oxidase [Gyrodon lividus]
MGLSRFSRRFPLLGLLAALSGVFAQNPTNTPTATPASNHTTVLILGGGMAGIIAARTLHEQGIDDFIIIEGKIELGGRMIPKAFGIPGRQVVVEMGPNWIQGTQQGNGPANPIWELALKHNLSTVYNDLYGSITTYDYNGYNNYTDTFNRAVDTFAQATVVAGQRLHDGEVDMSLHSAYGIMGVSPKTPQENACDYYQIDWECKCSTSFLRILSPSQTSWLASAWNNNFTYAPEAGGYSDENYMSVDPRGFVYIAQAEAAEFLQSKQMVYNQTVNVIDYSEDSVTVKTTGGMTLTADHVLCTFSAGVLRNTDVVFQPALPDWKIEAINSIEMVTYTKIFLQFNETFWFPTEMGLYADKQRGRYPVWQSLDHVGFFPGSGIIFVTVTGDWSLYVEQLSLQEVQSEVMEVLRAMYPDTTIPEPVDIHMSTWASDTLYRGSYSNWGPSYVQAHSDNLRATVDNRLWFAGEATSLKYFGFLQGAYLEGQNVGSALAACVKGKGSCQLPHTNTVTNAQPYSSSLTDA